MSVRTDIEVIKNQVEAISKRQDNLMALLTPRIEKWDDTSTKVGFLMNAYYYVIGGVISVFFGVVMLAFKIFNGNK